MEKTFTLNTHDCQMAVITLIESHCESGLYLKDKPEVYNKLCDMFVEMNKLCREGNDYTITVTVKG